jgi:hypothetical protein
VYCSLSFCAERDILREPLISVFGMSTQRICTGLGDCLEQNCDRSIDSVYVKYRDVICHHDCEPVKCPNFAVCGEIGPQWYFNCHRGWCWSCKDKFGKTLTFLEEPAECPICTEVGSCVVQPNCNHSICITCFKRTRIDGPPREPQPPFPYPDRDDEYNSLDAPAELLRDPLVLAWNTQLEHQDLERSMRYQAEEYLRKCPLCRS